MLRSLRFLAASLTFAIVLLPAHAEGFRGSGWLHGPKPLQETGFLNRVVELHGTAYRFQIYLPESFRRDDHKPWPVILFLHGRGERGTEGMWQTQVGLPQALRDHPERWPFVVVMPQCPLGSFWTDPNILSMAMAALEQETAEFHLDTKRTYLSGISMGGYGAWELEKQHPGRWAAMAVAAGGIFWSYEPERWQQATTLPAEYAHTLGRTAVWLFHGGDDNVVNPRQSELLYDAVKATGGRVRLWVYQGMRHDCWTRAYNEPELPRWLLTHHLDTKAPAPQPFAERLLIPLHPPAIRLSEAQEEAVLGDYRDTGNRSGITVVRQGDMLFAKNIFGDMSELAAESPTVFFYPLGPSINRLIFERKGEGRVTGAVFRDDRHEEHWEKRTGAGR